MQTWYLAITKFNTTKENPFYLARCREGIFERYKDGKWEEDTSLYDISIGEFIDYEEITEEEANRIIKYDERKDRFITKAGEIIITNVPKKKDI